MALTFPTEREMSNRLMMKRMNRLYRPVVVLAVQSQYRVTDLREVFRIKYVVRGGEQLWSPVFEATDEADLHMMALAALEG